MSSQGYRVQYARSLGKDRKPLQRNIRYSRSASDNIQQNIHWVTLQESGDDRGQVGEINHQKLL